MLFRRLCRLTRLPILRSTLRRFSDFSDPEESSSPSIQQILTGYFIPPKSEERAFWLEAELKTLKESDFGSLELGREMQQAVVQLSKTPSLEYVPRDELAALRKTMQTFYVRNIYSATPSQIFQIIKILGVLDGFSIELAILGTVRFLGVISLDQADQIYQFLAACNLAFRAGDASSRKESLGLRKSTDIDHYVAFWEILAKRLAADDGHQAVNILHIFEQLSVFHSYVSEDLLLMRSAKKIQIIMENFKSPLMELLQGPYSESDDLARLNLIYNLHKSSLLIEPQLLPFLVKKVEAIDPKGKEGLEEFKIIGTILALIPAPNYDFYFKKLKEFDIPAVKPSVLFKVLTILTQLDIHQTEIISSLFKILGKSWTGRLAHDKLDAVTTRSIHRCITILSKDPRYGPVLGIFPRLVQHCARACAQSQSPAFKEKKLNQCSDFLANFKEVHGHLPDPGSILKHERRPSEYEQVIFDALNTYVPIIFAKYPSARVYHELPVCRYQVDSVILIEELGLKIALEQSGAAYSTLDNRLSRLKETKDLALKSEGWVVAWIQTTDFAVFSTKKHDLKRIAKLLGLATYIEVKRQRGITLDLNFVLPDVAPLNQN